MTPRISVQDVVDELARDPLRHIVLLKHLVAYPEHVRIHRVSDATGVATLIMLEASVSPYDRQTYPRATLAAFISSDHPELAAALMLHVPRGVGIVFKLSREDDLAPVRSHFAVKRRTAFVSFTSSAAVERDADVRIRADPDDATLQLFAAQGHDRSWLEPLLQNGRAIACVLARGGETLSACIAFENYGPVWEVGGVVTAPSHRRRGLGTRVVRTALAELFERALTPRYQVEAHNRASIGLARSAGLAPFLTIVHYAHGC
jgi:ribosomal protein S18 acetylase RimI-like enzyme